MESRASNELGPPGGRLPGRGGPSESSPPGGRLPGRGGLKDLLRRGDPMIWLVATGLAASLLMIAALLALVLMKGLGFFWPQPLVELLDREGGKWVAQVLQREPIPGENGKASPGFRIRVKIGNRDLDGLDFKWIDESAIAGREIRPDALLLERQEYGNFHGYLKELRRGGQKLADGGRAGIAALREAQSRLRPAVKEIRERQKTEVGGINAQLERQRLLVRKAELEGSPDLARVKTQAEARIADLKRGYESLVGELRQKEHDSSETVAVVVDAQGREKTLAVHDLVRVVTPNSMTFLQKVALYASRLSEFFWGEPRESNTEGGVFPAIFGTVLMVVMMSAIVMPFGVIAALYLREYARQGRLVAIVRIAVNDLAGVPSIVFGVFGLGFFVYALGGSMDRLLFPESLPSPTYGTGGILWCALTLALLTVPVVVVATEEALAAVPRGVREASYALGATKWQTTWRVVLPAAAPGILTGLILAISRGTGEVAPLMIIGVVKLAPNLPFDGTFPFLHLERKIMHLGFHIYDVGFQSPNVEGALPMVYTTTILLVLVVVTLNLTAILIRNRLRKKLQTSAF